MNRELVIDYLADVSQYLKLSKFCRLCGIPPGSLSQVLLYGSYAVSEEKLILLYETVKDYARKIA